MAEKEFKALQQHKQTAKQGVTYAYLLSRDFSQNMIKRPVVAAYGAFDGIHPGHLYYLNQARKCAGYLVIVISRDKSKWSFQRKFNLNEHERKRLVEKLKIADKVVLGSESDPLLLVKKYNPDYIIMTEYHPISREDLERKLREQKIKTKIIIAKITRPEIYDKIYLSRDKKIYRQLMGVISIGWNTFLAKIKPKKAFANLKKSLP